MAENYDASAVALSASTAHTLVTESPYHAWAFHRLLGNRRRTTTDSQQKGSLWHAALLENGKGIEVIEADSFRTKDAKAAKADALAAGRIPIVAPKWEEMQPALAEVREKIAAAGVSFDDGQFEVKLEWSEESYEEPVLCHARLDWLSDAHTRIIDLKTSDASAHPDNCASRIYREGSDIQEAAYLSAVETIWPDVAGRTEFLFLFVETREPYAVTPIITAGSMRELGESRWYRAVEKWAECLKTNQWPSYVEKPYYRAYAPAWALSWEMEEDGNE